MALRDFFRRKPPTRDQNTPKGKDIARGYGIGSIFGLSGTALASGGATNLNTGMGTEADHSQQTEYLQRALQGSFYFNHQLEALWIGSYICGKAVDLPIEDMLARWRDYESDDEKMVEMFMKAEKQFKVRHALSKGMRAAKLFGTGLVVMVTKEAPLHTPLDPTMIKPGDLVGFRVYTRYDMTIEERGSMVMQSNAMGETTKDPMMNDDGMPMYSNDFFDPNYDMPAIYKLHLTEGSDMLIHHSRIIRFDGITPLSDKGFSSQRGSSYRDLFNKDWGASEVIRMIQAIVMDETIWNSIAHVASEWTIPVFSSPEIAAALASSEDPNESSLGEIMKKVRDGKSVYKMLAIGSEGSISRLDVRWSGLPDIIDRMFKVVAAVADIPATRFYGQSPIGLNSTGTSDEHNYLMKLQSYRENNLTDVMDVIDQVMAANMGWSEPIPYEWTSLFDFSETEQVQNSKTKMEALDLALEKNVIDENEARERLNGDPLFQELPEIDLDELYERQIQKMHDEMMSQQPPDNGNDDPPKNDKPM